MRLKVYLATIDMTVKDFAAVLGCNRTYLSRIARGNAKPGKRLAKDIQELTDGQVTLVEEAQKKMQVA